MKIERIKTYPDNIIIYNTDGTEYEIRNVGAQTGEYTKTEWEEELKEQGYNKEEIEEILNTLENTSNKNYFREE